jgi:hypothetical protein
MEAKGMVEITSRISMEEDDEARTLEELQRRGSAAARFHAVALRRSESSRAGRGRR